MIKGIFYILLFLFLGETAAYLMNGAIPGSVIGMVLLFLSLKLKVVNPEDVRGVAYWLTKNMALFFVPASIGIMSAWDLISAHWFALTIVAVVTTILVVAVVAMIQEHAGKKSST
ncbi:MAG: CidA/LrgA family protein [Bacteroidales bacterium]